MTGRSSLQEVMPSGTLGFGEPGDSPTPQSELYAVLRNNRQHRWLVPASNGALALSGLNVYQPYGIVGRAVKRALALSIRCGLNFYARKTLAIDSTDAIALRGLIEDLTGERDCGFSLLIGNFGPYRKAVIQVMAPSGSVLGYLKIPLTSKADERVRNEARAVAQAGQLPELKGRVPQILFAGQWKGRYVLLQKPLAGRRSPPRFEPVHRDFLSSLAGLGLVYRSAESVVGEVALHPSKLSRVFSSEEIDATLRVASGWIGESKIQCGFTHGDFAPWNMRVCNGQLQVFDWERGHRDLPMTWDYFHFITQSEILLNARAAQSQRRHLWQQGTLDARATYLLYLLQSTAVLIEEGVSETDRAVTTRRRWLLEVLTLLN